MTRFLKLEPGTGNLVLSAYYYKYVLLSRCTFICYSPLKFLFDDESDILSQFLGLLLRSSLRTFPQVPKGFGHQGVEPKLLIYSWTRQSSWTLSSHQPACPVMAKLTLTSDLWRKTRFSGPSGLGWRFLFSLAVITPHMHPAELRPPHFGWLTGWRTWWDWRETSDSTGRRATVEWMSGN